MKLFEKTYNYEGLYDLPEDVEYSLDERFNDLWKQIPKDKYHYALGEFKLTIEWIPPEDDGFLRGEKEDIDIE